MKTYYDELGITNPEWRYDRFRESLEIVTSKSDLFTNIIFDWFQQYYAEKIPSPSKEVIEAFANLAHFFFLIGYLKGYQRAEEDKKLKELLESK